MSSLQISKQEGGTNIHISKEGALQKVRVELERDSKIKGENTIAKGASIQLQIGWATSPDIRELTMELCDLVDSLEARIISLEKIIREKK